MKRVLMAPLVMAILFGMVAGATAQSGEQPAKTKSIAKTVKEHALSEKRMPAPEVQLERLAKGLRLTAEQQKQILPLLEDEYAKLKEVIRDESLSPRQKQEKVEELRAGTVAKMQSYMTPEQREKHDLISKEIKANKQKRIKENRKARIGSNVSPPEQANQ